MEYKKNKDYIVCIDSDGCAMDTMNIKHTEYFGPLLIKEWKIENKEKFTKIWNEVNLYSVTRGINRFKGFLLVFKKMKETGETLGDIDQIEKWINSTKELSNVSLEKEILKQKENKISKEKISQLEKLLDWSKSVNLGIKELEKIDRPFDGVKKALKNISDTADIAIVSSANREAIISEWTRHDLLKYTNIIFSQEEGSKSDCIAKVKKMGYEDRKILMVGDSPGDLEAANENKVLFYPILFGKEKEMWEELVSMAKEKFLTGRYEGEYEKKLIEKFDRNFSDK